MNALGEMRELIAPTILTGGKTIAGTFLNLVVSPKTLAETRAEFDSRVAEDPMRPLLPTAFEPPIDLPWPDYRVDRLSGERCW
jgi:aminobenzoyl-glutamate utilization protein B